MPVDINSSLQSDDVFARLRMGIKDLPTQQKLICSYILDNYQQVAFYTVEELAQASKTSPATVVRVVKRLGYDSYKELLEQLQKVMMTTNNSVWWELEQVMNNSSEVEKEPDSMNTAVHSLTVTPVVSFPQERVMVYVSILSALLIAFLTLFKASADSSSLLPATFTISNCPLPNTGCLLIKSFKAFAALTPGTIQRECLNKSLYSSLEYGYALSLFSFVM